ncbi:trypsin-like [Astyanax mexicanus]|uniref:trypsin n=1 Tax=Astyanax mexicanus TaxID=7994 RepID=A0A8T2L9Q3_ASTMX|nr:trypsin-like [Astyanax mexicanus]
MATTAVLLLLSLLAEGVVSSAVEKRLVSAKPCAATERPYHARVVYELQGEHTTCAGTLIHKKWVITASHCYGGPDGILTVELGGHLNNVKKKSQRIEHANVIIYSPSDEPIMLLKLPEAVKSIVPAVLKPGHCVVPDDGDELMVSGRGATNAEGGPGVKDLMCLKLKSLSKGHCPDISGSNYEKYKFIFCGGAIDNAQIKACKGDSGSGVVRTEKVTKSSLIFWTKEKQYEMFSGVLISGEKECEDNFVFVNTCADKIKSWIDSVLKGK